MKSNVVNKQAEKLKMKYKKWKLNYIFRNRKMMRLISIWW